MKKCIPFGVILALFLGSAGFFPIKKDKLTADTVSEIIEQFPAENNDRQCQLAANIFSLGSKAVKTICMDLDAPGEGRDTAQRFALSAMAAYAGRMENEKERRVFVDAVADSLQKHPNKKAKPFLIQMLQQTGRRDAVKPLQYCLRDPDLCGCAARALKTIGTSSAEKALLKALPSAPFACRASLIKHLGEFRSLKSVNKIKPYAAALNPELRQAALFALANSGSPEAEEILLKSYVLASPSERAEAPHLLLLYVRRAAEDGRTRAAADLALEIIRNFRNPGEMHTAAAALSLIVDLRGKEAMATLLEAANSPDPEYRGQGYRLAADFPGLEVTEAWIEKAESSSPAVQAEIITWLADRRDQAAVRYIHHKLKSEDGQVRKAALKATVICAEEKMLPEIIQLLPMASVEELTFITQALLRMPADSAVTAVVSCFNDVPAGAQACLLQVLSARRARSYSGLVFSLLQSEDEALRKAAFLSLEHMVSSSDSGRLVDLMFQLKDKQKISMVQTALAASVNQISECEARATPIMNALEKAEGDKRIDFIRPLAQIGGGKALKTVLDAYYEDDMKMKTAAVYTLSEWPEFTAVEHLLHIAREAKWGKNRYLALQGFSRLVTESEISPSLKSNWMKKAIDLPQNNTEANVLLSGLSRIKTREALNLAKKFYTWTGLENKTAWTVVQIILPTPEKKGMLGKDLVPPLQKTLEIIENEYDRERILRYIETLQSVRANVTARISRAPDCSRIRPHSWSVAPVV